MPVWSDGDAALFADFEGVCQLKLMGRARTRYPLFTETVRRVTA